ncbi:hypothetical protein B296_00030768 [Ensete ventricosum]|uniref:Uncharacterized protein n=1 Tax=Ensete ventricosum TaxID=4639 RepID=A0A427AC06_ENSVE|nr:hypothetical protein B296_00030768 [Ensete ventricosum]
MGAIREEEDEEQEGGGGELSGRLKVGRRRTRRKRDNGGCRGLGGPLVGRQELSGWLSSGRGAFRKGEGGGGGWGERNRTLTREWGGGGAPSKARNRGRCGPARSRGGLRVRVRLAGFTRSADLPLFTTALARLQRREPKQKKGSDGQKAPRWTYPVELTDRIDGLE